jgi:hypothetical protein
MRHEVNKQYCNMLVPYCRREEFVRYTVEGATYGFHAKFHDDRFRHSSNIKVITSKISGSVMLVFL